MQQTNNPLAAILLLKEWLLWHAAAISCCGGVLWHVAYRWNLVHYHKNNQHLATDVFRVWLGTNTVDILQSDLTLWLLGHEQVSNQGSTQKKLPTI